MYWCLMTGLQPHRKDQPLPGQDDHSAHCARLGGAREASGPIPSSNHPHTTLLSITRYFRCKRASKAQCTGWWKKSNIDILEKEVCPSLMNMKVQLLQPSSPSSGSWARCQVMSNLPLHTGFKKFEKLWASSTWKRYVGKLGQNRKTSTDSKYIVDKFSRLSSLL